MRFPYPTDRIGMRRVAAAVVVAILGGIAFDTAGVPMAWMVGPATFSIALTLLTGRSSVLPQKAYQFATLIIAASIGLSFSPDALHLVSQYAAFIAVLVTATIGFSVVVGLLIARWTRTDAITALISSIPAGASGMVILSRELGADQQFVAATQYLRVTAVVTLVPFIAARLSPSVAVEPAVPNRAEGLLPVHGSDLSGIQALIVALLLGTAGAMIAKRLRIAASGFLGPLTALVIARLAGLPLLELPPVVLDAALLAVGATIGSQFDWPTLVLIGRAFVISAGLTLGMILACGVLGYGLHLVTGIDSLTTVLATTPGGMEVVTVTALEMGADASFVTAVQLVRLFAVLLAVPFLLRWLRRAEPAQPGAGTR